VSAFSWLEEWYSSRCNGDWEHQYGVEIGTLDNPGWSVKIDLIGTKAENSTLDRTKLERSKQDWICYFIEKHQFTAYCGPQNLSEAIEVFAKWFETSV
jgi:hypothetical protein